MNFKLYDRHKKEQLSANVPFFTLRSVIGILLTDGFNTLLCIGLLQLPDSDSDSKSYGYIVLCTTCFH